MEKSHYLSPYLWSSVDYPDYYSSYYPKTVDDVLTVGGFEKGIDPLKATTNEQERMILAVGAKVMSGQLPLVPETLKELLETHTNRIVITKQSSLDENSILEIFRSVVVTQIETAQANSKIFTAFIDTQVTKIKATRGASLARHDAETMDEDFRVIQGIFRDAINVVEASDKEQNEVNKKTFVTSVKALRKETIAHFFAQDSGFNFESCKKIADSTKDLAEKVASNTVTQEDIDAFIKITRPDQHADALAIILTALIGAVLGMIAGAAVGFVVGGGVPAAILGGVAGLGAGLAISGFGCTMFYSQKDALNLISEASADLLQQSLPVSVP